MQIHHQVELPVPVKIPCPDDLKVWLINESVSRIQHLCPPPSGQDDLGVGEIRGFRLDPQVVPQLSERDLQWPVGIQIVVGDACALDLARPQTRNAPDREHHLGRALDGHFLLLLLQGVLGPVADD
jgi:hypothetical protein